MKSSGLARRALDAGAKRRRENAFEGENIGMKIISRIALATFILMKGAAAPAWAEPEAPVQTESAGITELRRALEGFLVIAAINPQTGEFLQVKSEPGGVEIIRPLIYLDAEAAYVDWLGGGIPQEYPVVAANGMDVIAKTQGAAVWMGRAHDATMAQTRIDQPGLFYVTTKDDDPVLHNFEGGARLPMFVRQADASKFLDTARRNMAPAGGAAPDLVVTHTDMMSTLQGIIRGEIIGVSLISPDSNARWAEQNRQGLRSLNDYVTDSQALMDE
jgi:hypothetical protein